MPTKHAAIHIIIGIPRCKGKTCNKLMEILALNFYDLLLATRVWLLQSKTQTMGNYKSDHTICNAIFKTFYDVACQCQVPCDTLNLKMGTFGYDCNGKSLHETESLTLTEKNQKLT